MSESFSLSLLRSFLMTLLVVSCCFDSFSPSINSSPICWSFSLNSFSLDRLGEVKKGKGMFLYSTLSRPLERSKRFTLFALPGRPVQSDTNSASLRSILAMQQLRATTRRSHFNQRSSMTKIFHSSTTAIPPLGGATFYTGTMLFNGSSWQVIYLISLAQIYVSKGGKADYITSLISP